MTAKGDIDVIVEVLCTADIAITLALIKLMTLRVECRGKINRFIKILGINHSKECRGALSIVVDVLKIIQKKEI